MASIGRYAFIIGVLIAIIIGIAGSGLGSSKLWLTSFLAVFGLLVGLFNVSGKETKDFLLMATVLVVSAYAGNASGILLSVQFAGPYLSGVFSALLTFLVPATIVAALRGIWALGKD